MTTPHLALATLTTVIALLALADAISRVRVRSRKGRMVVWYASPHKHSSNVRLIRAETSAGTFVGWLDSHPCHPTNQPTSDPSTSEEK